MATVLCDDDYIWSLCSLSTLAVISQVCGPQDQLAANFWRQTQAAGKQALRTHKAEDLDQAIVLGALAIKYLNDELVKQSFRQYGYNWCYLLEKKWLMSRDDEDKTRLLAAWTKFFQIVSSYHSDAHRALDTEKLQERHGYQKTPSDENWEKCFQVAEILIEAAHGRREEAYAISQLGVLAYSRGSEASDFETRKAMFESGLSFQEKAVSLRQSDDLVNLGIYYGHIAWNHAKLWEIERIKFTERLEHCNAAIEIFEKTIDLLGSENGAWQRCSDQLARLYWGRWHETFKGSDAESGIKVFESILAIHPSDSHAQSGLAMLQNQQAHNKVMSNVQRRRESDRSLQMLQNVIVNTALADTNLPARLGRCSVILEERFTYDGCLQDSDVAIELQMTALNLPQISEEDVSGYYADLSKYWQKRYHHTRIQSDLASGEEAARNAVKAAGHMPFYLEVGLTQLARTKMISYQFGITKNGQVIDDAISNFREAMALRPQQRSNNLLLNIGAALLAKFRDGGSYQAASEGIEYLREAVDILRRQKGKGNDPFESTTMSTLAHALVTRYQKLSGKEDIDEAIRLYRKLVEDLDDEHVDWTGYVVDLCFALGLRYAVTFDDVDIAEAQQRGEFAISNVNERTSLNQLLRLENMLGMFFSRKFIVNKDLKDIEAAIKHFKTCRELASAPLDVLGTDMGEVATGNLTQALRVKALSTKAENDYMAAIQFYSHLISDHRKRIIQPSLTIFESLADVALSYWRQGGSSDSNETRPSGSIALSAYQHILQSEKTPINRIDAAVHAAELSYFLNRDRESAKTYSKMAVNSLVEAATLGLSRLDHLRLMKRFANVPNFGLSYSILGKDAPEKALQEFESARTLVWNRLLDDKSPADSLITQHPELAQKFDIFRAQLAERREPISHYDTDRMKFAAPDYYRVALEYTDLLLQIRKLNGFEDFLLTPSNVQFMQGLARDGPVAVVNITSWYSHAVLIQGTNVHNIGLPVRNQDCIDHHKRFEEALKKVSQDIPVATNLLGQVMQSMWEGIAKPVLDALGFQKPTTRGPLPRMWWVTTGWLNVLPIHAAATFSDSPGGTIVDSVMDRVVSSYVPNLRALQFARKRRDTTTQHLHPPDLGTALFVQMPKTPGHDPLTNAEKEVDEAIRIVGKSYESVRCDKPRRNQVLREMQNASIVHFVCHGIADSDDPTKSRLLLSDHVTAPFDVRAWHKAKLDNCRLAYLSACETAMTKNLALKDEGIHIADTVLMAGVPNVIATWWRVVDEESVNVASGFYENLVDGCGGFDSARSGRAIHAAAKSLRDGGTNPFIWAAYVHFGA